MAAVDVTGRVNARTIARLGAQRRESADNYKLGGETGKATTFTVTFVVTTGSSPSADTITCDYAST